MKYLLLACALISQLAFGAACAGRAHNNMMNQTGWAAYSYTNLQWTDTVDNVGGYFNTTNGTITPPAGAITFGGQLWISPANLAYVQSYVVKIFKNDSVTPFNNYQDTISGICTLGVIPNTVVCQIPGVTDVTDGTVRYKLMLYSTSSSAIVDGNPAHTYLTWVCL